MTVPWGTWVARETRRLLAAWRKSEAEGIEYTITPDGVLRVNPSSVIRSPTFRRQLALVARIREAQGR